VEGNLKLVLGLVWSLIQRYQISARAKIPPKKLMMAWIQACFLIAGRQKLEKNASIGRPDVIETIVSGGFTRHENHKLSHKLERRTCAERFIGLLPTGLVPGMATHFGE
jgi:hypothetical protein